MIINFKKSGGFAGFVTSKTIDTKHLDRTKAIELEGLIRRINLDKFPPRIPPLSKNTGAADYFTYKIEVEDSDRKRYLERSDINMEPELRPLINYLVKNVR